MSQACTLTKRLPSSTAMMLFACQICFATLQFFAFLADTMNIQPRANTPKNDDNRSPRSHHDAASILPAPHDTPIFSQVGLSAIAAAHFPAGKKKASVTRKVNLKKAPCMNLAAACLSKPSPISNRKSKPTNSVDKEGFALVTARNPKPSAEPKTNTSRKPKACARPPPIPSFTQSASLSPVNQVSESASFRTTTTTVKTNKCFKVTDCKKQVVEIQSNSHLDLTQSDSEDHISPNRWDFTQSDTEDALPPSGVAVALETPTKDAIDDFLKDKEENEDSKPAADSAAVSVERSIRKAQNLFSDSGPVPSDDPNGHKSGLDMLRRAHAKTDGSLPSLTELNDSEDLSIAEKTLLFNLNKALATQRISAAAGHFSETAAAGHTSGRNSDDPVNSPANASIVSAVTMSTASGTSNAAAVDLASPVRQVQVRGRRVSGGSGVRATVTSTFNQDARAATEAMVS